MALATQSRSTEKGAFIVDRQGTVLAFDQGMEELTAYSAVAVVGQNKERIGSSPINDGAPARFPLPLFVGELPPVDAARVIELSLFGSDGRRLDVEALVQGLAGPGERLQVTVLRVVGRSAEPMRGVEQGGVEGLDSLTGFGDGVAFRKRIQRDFEQAVELAHPLALLHVDVDNLADVNSRFGWDAGDLVLEKLAALLRTRFDDARIFRIDEDDFGVVLPDCGRGDARQVAAGIRSTLERFRFATSDGSQEPLNVTLSIGAASFPADADNPSDLLQRSAEALDEARRMGRNRVWCYMRRPRVPVEVPVFFDATEELLVGYSRDLSPSGIFVQTSAPLEIGMRCALAFDLPEPGENVRVIGRVVRTVPVESLDDQRRIPGMGIEFERFAGDDARHAIDLYLHRHEDESLRPESGILSL